MKSTKIAYLLWALGIFGCLGLQQFYLKNYEKGILYLLTFGGFGFGACYDLLSLSAQVEATNTNKDSSDFWVMTPFKDREVWVDLYQA